MIDRDAIEAKARQFEDALSETKESVQSVAMMAAAGVTVIILVAYLLGRRRGKRSGARIEIHKL